MSVSLTLHTLTLRMMAVMNSGRKRGRPPLEATPTRKLSTVTRTPESFCDTLKNGTLTSCYTLPTHGPGYLGLAVMQFTATLSPSDCTNRSLSISDLRRCHTLEYS